MHAAVAMPHHDHGLAPELGGDEVAGLRHLAGMPDEQPGTAEDALHLKLEQFGIGIDVAMDASRLDQACDAVRVSIAHRAYSAA